MAVAGLGDIAHPRPSTTPGQLVQVSSQLSSNFGSHHDAGEGARHDSDK